ncbi:hypothetical protein FRB95_002027 [Tulasnella sp. JGI-2019a]|nr:hypothetical protein FRB95_002027 [Tulasnella sp. JGI-2019a]
MEPIYQLTDDISHVQTTDPARPAFSIPTQADGVECSPLQRNGKKRHWCVISGRKAAPWNPAAASFMAWPTHLLRKDISGFFASYSGSGPSQVGLVTLGGRCFPQQQVPHEPIPFRLCRVLVVVGAIHRNWLPSRHFRLSIYSHT